MRGHIALQGLSCEILITRFCYFAKLLECVRVLASLWIFEGLSDAGRVQIMFGRSHHCSFCVRRNDRPITHAHLDPGSSLLHELYSIRGIPNLKTSSNRKRVGDEAGLLAFVASECTDSRAGAGVAPRIGDFAA
jgi:hypothetical protein